MGVEIIPVYWELAYQAARFKIRGSIAYADCFATALAQLKKADLVTGDQEFKQVEGGVKIIWL